MAQKKRCSKCGELKVLSEFHQHTKAKDGHKSECKICACISSRQYRAQHLDEQRAYERRYGAEHREERRTYLKQYYSTHKEKVKETRAVRRRKAKAWYANFLTTHPCIICNTYTQRRACHHIGQKNHNVSTLVTKGYPIHIIEAEIELCVILCFSCHTKLHGAERKRKRLLRGKIG